MATERPSDTRVVSRLAGRGEDAITRLMDELSRNQMVTDALARAMSAKGRLDAASRSALAQVGLAPVDDVRELRQQLADLEQRVAKLEEAGKTEAAKPRRGRTAATSTKTTGAAGASSRSRRSTPPA